MTIETKYNIGDEVWGAAHEEIWSGRITAIIIYYAFGMSRIGYKVFVEEEMHFTLREQDLFPTKEELLKSL
jgi:hypothetical protein